MQSITSKLKTFLQLPAMLLLVLLLFIGFLIYIKISTALTAEQKLIQTDKWAKNLLEDESFGIVLCLMGALLYILLWLWIIN